MLEKGKMMDSREAEARAKEIIKQRHPKVKRIFFQDHVQRRECLGVTWRSRI